MTRSSPARRSIVLSSPESKALSNFLADNRNDELSHRDALLAAQAEHQRVRLAAIRVYELYELQEEHRRIVEDKRKEEERLEAEALVAAEEIRLRELRAKTIPRPPPPEPEPEPPAKAPPVQQEPPSAIPNGSTPTRHSTRLEPSTTPPSEGKKPATQPNGLFSSRDTPTAPSTMAKVQPTLARPSASTAQVQTLVMPSPPTVRTVPVPPPPAPIVTARPAVARDRYKEIHQELKKLRKDLQAQSKVAGSPLKGRMGTFRREIRVSIGQLTAGRGANDQPTRKITAILTEALQGQVPSPPIDVSLFVCDQREPIQGAAHNDATLPSLFIYLVNICAKGIINQFINECSANPKAADPIGVFTAGLFSREDFQWRGQSLIDILMAKFRIACPVLFGFRGNDRMERGRLAIGWKKDGPSWITEQNHNDRMTGLGAGFAAIALRDFSRSSKPNPYPPTNYWKALAGIVNTPPGEISNTQYVVLRSMIEGHEKRFLTFYGNAAIAALRLALIEFPQKAPQHATAAGSLRALADVLSTEKGLVLT